MDAKTQCALLFCFMLSVGFNLVSASTFYFWYRENKRQYLRLSERLAEEKLILSDMRAKSREDKIEIARMTRSLDKMESLLQDYNQGF